MNSIRAGYYVKISCLKINIIQIPCDEKKCEKKYDTLFERVNSTGFNTGITLDNTVLYHHLCDPIILADLNLCLGLETNPNICLQRDMFARSCIDGVMYKYNNCRSKHFRCND